MQHVLALLLLCALMPLAQAAAPERPATPVMVKSLARGPLSWPVTLYGRVSAVESLALSAAVTETLSAVHVKDGQTVSAGALLFEMTSLEEQALINQARAQLIDAQQQYDRVSQLKPGALASQDTIDQKRAALDSAKGQLKSIEAKLADRLVFAPYDGRLGLRQVSLGSLVRPGDVLAHLDVAAQQLTLEIPEALSRDIPVDTPYELVSLDGQTRAAGRILALDNRLNPSSLSLAARGSISGGPWINGSRVRVDIQRSLQNVLSVPEGALLQEGTRSFVFVVGSDNRAQKQAVTVLGRSAGQVAIADGLPEGSAVVTQGAARLTPGASIKVVAQEQGQPLHELLQGGKP
jgi:membrane fusion protein, multidrug efflux system